MRKQCKRKVWSLINPIQHAIDGARVTAEKHLNHLRLVELGAIEAFAKGRARPEDWRALADMLNICETLAKDGIGPEALTSIEAASAALENAHARFKAGKTMGFTGEELQHVRDVCQYIDLQRQVISRQELEQAIRKTADRIRSAHPDLKVYA